MQANADYQQITKRPGETPLFSGILSIFVKYWFLGKMVFLECEAIGMV
jgi:hypothetical protein